MPEGLKIKLFTPCGSGFRPGAGALGEGDWWSNEHLIGDGGLDRVVGFAKAGDDQLRVC